MIHKIKKRINRIDSKNRISDPLAIVFTKADTLPEQHAKKSAKDLASGYYDLMLWLNASHSGPRSYFKLSAKTTEERPEGYDDEEYNDGEECDDGEPADPGEYLAIPLDYSVEEYERLITWLVSPR